MDAGIAGTGRIGHPVDIGIGGRNVVLQPFQARAQSGQIGLPFTFQVALQLVALQSEQAVVLLHEAVGQVGSPEQIQPENVLFTGDGFEGQLADVADIFDEKSVGQVDGRLGVHFRLVGLQNDMVLLVGFLFLGEDGQRQSLKVLGDTGGFLQGSTPRPQVVPGLQVRVLPFLAGQVTEPRFQQLGVDALGSGQSGAGEVGILQ